MAVVRPTGIQKHAFNASEITAAVVHQIFPPRRWAVCPNVSWGMLPWEADILALSKNNVIHEVEVKVTASDLKRDLLKDKFGVRPAGEPPWSRATGHPRWDARQNVHRFWYAVPETLADLAIEQGKFVGAGVISCRWTGAQLPGGTSLVAERVMAPQRWPGPQKWEPEEWRRNLERLCSLRYWDMMQVGRTHDIAMALRRAVHALPEGELKTTLEEFQLRFCPGNVLREAEDGVDTEGGVDPGDLVSPGSDRGVVGG